MGASLLLNWYMTKNQKYCNDHHGHLKEKKEVFKFSKESLFKGLIDFK